MSAQTMKLVGVVKEIRKKNEENRKEKSAERASAAPLSHNSLQHDDVRTLPLLDSLVKALEKDQKEKSTDSSIQKIKEKSIAEMTKELLEEISEKKDSIAIIAEHIKQLYANDISQQVYAQSPLRSYNPAMDYGQGTSVKKNSQMYGQTEGDDAKASSTEAQNNGAARLVDENSAAYRLSAGTKIQAFIMSDPKGRIHSTWNVIRVVNESSEGYITQNNGLHYQGLS